MGSAFLGTVIYRLMSSGWYKEKNVWKLVFIQGETFKYVRIIRIGMYRSLCWLSVYLYHQMILNESPKQSKDPHHHTINNQQFHKIPIIVTATSYIYKLILYSCDQTARPINLALPTIYTTIKIRQRIITCPPTRARAPPSHSASYNAREKAAAAPQVYQPAI